MFKVLGIIIIFSTNSFYVASRYHLKLSGNLSHKESIKSQEKRPSMSLTKYLINH